MPIAPHPESDQSPLETWELDRARSATVRLANAIHGGAVDPCHVVIVDRLDALASWPVGWFPSNIRTATREAERLVENANV